MIFSWLQEPHLQEFWDTTQEHKDDILNFMNGRKEPSSYCDGLYIYWLGVYDGVPYSMIMTIQEKTEYDSPPLKKAHLSTTGSTYSFDYMIGNPNYLGKGLGAVTLERFVDFFKGEVDPEADTFFIDPQVANQRACHTFKKAGFLYVGDFVMEGTGHSRGRQNQLLVKKL